MARSQAGSGTESRAPSRAKDQRFPTSARLRRRRDYQRAYRHGTRRSGAFFVVYRIANEAGAPRLGITVSRKVGNSVVRHRVKRRVRETYRLWPGRDELGAVDLVVHARPPAAAGDSEALGRELLRLLSSRKGQSRCATESPQR